MSIQIPTTQEIKNQNLTNLESNLNQISPLADKAFLRVLAAMEALAISPLYKFAIERAKQNLALTATGNDLDIIGSEYGVNRNLAEAAQLTATIPGIDSTIISAGTGFIGVPNGVRYFTDAQVIVTGGIGTLALTAEVTGVVGNLQVSDILTISTQIAGLESTATITVVDNIGTEQETDDNYRVRVLGEVRGTSGGANAFDYRSWAQEVSGVKKAYPIAGKPIGMGSTAPPDRTVYIETTTTINADGIAPQSLLDEVRATITTDPITGLARQPLGLTDSTLFIKSIERLDFDVQIGDLNISSDIVAQVKADISTALELYFRSIISFVEGLDALIDRNDLITNLTVSEQVQNVLSANGGSAETIAFNLSSTPGAFVTLFQLLPGQLAKTGTVTYV